MLKAFQGLVLMAILGLLAVGCGNDNNPMGSGDTNLKPNSPQSPSMLGNRVWNDVNKNGLQDDTLLEPGIPGVVVALYSCADVQISTFVTNPKGLYFFPMLLAVDYYIKFTLPNGYVFTSKDAGPDTLDSDADPATGKTECISLAGSTADLTWDAGLYAGRADTVVNGTVGGRIWLDANRDGIQNDTLWNDVLNAVQVELFTCAGLLTATTMTDTAGEYDFIDIVPGSYYLLFTLPIGYMFAPADMTDDTLDSDADTLTGKTACFDVDSAGVDMTWAVGIWKIPVPEGCTRSKGYWKNHAGLGPQEDMVTALLPIHLGSADSAAAMGVTDARTAVDILQMQTYGAPSNGITKLYAQLLAAKLNIAAGADGADADAVITEADLFVGNHDWQSWGQLSKDEQKQVLTWMGTLGEYNEGLIGPGACGENAEGDSGLVLPSE